MAHWGMANTHVNQLDASVSKKRLSTGRNGSLHHKMQTVFHVALFAAAFIFVAAVVCGLLA